MSASTVSATEKEDGVELDWQFGKALPECLGTLLSYRHLCDVSFQFPVEKITLKAHKIMLAARSPVFEAMLFGPAGEKDAHPVIQITDAESSDFESMLELIYKDETNMNKDNVLGLLYLSHKYRLQYATLECCAYLAKTLCPANVLERQQSAIQLDLPLVQEQCIIYVDQHAVKVFSDESYLKLSKEVLNLILQRDSLLIPEIEVYKATILWARARCREQNLEDTGENLRKCLGSTVDLIRFPCMQATEVSLEVTKDGVLTKDEMLQALFSIVTPLVHSTKFKVTKRQSFFRSWPLSNSAGIYVPIPQSGFPRIVRPRSELPVLLRQTITINTEKRAMLFGLKYECQVPMSESIIIEGKIVLTSPSDGNMRSSNDRKCTDFSATVSETNGLSVYLLQTLLLEPGKECTLDIDLLMHMGDRQKSGKVTIDQGRADTHNTLQGSRINSLLPHSSMVLGANGET